MIEVTPDIEPLDINLDFPNYRVRLGYLVTGLPNHGYAEGEAAVRARAATDFPSNILGDPSQLAFRVRSRLVQKISNTSARYTLTWRNDRFVQGSGQTTAEAFSDTERAFLPTWVVQTIDGVPYYSFRERTFERSVNVLPMQAPIGGATLGFAQRVLSNAVGSMYYVGVDGDLDAIHVLSGYGVGRDSTNQLVARIQLRRPARVPASVDQQSGVVYPELQPLQDYIYSQPFGGQIPTVSATEECSRYFGGVGLIQTWFAAADPQLFIVECD